VLFTALLKAKVGSTTTERLVRRAQYSFPEGSGQLPSTGFRRQTLPYRS